MHDRLDQRFGMGLPDRFDDVDVTGRESHACARFHEIYDCQSDE